MSKLTPTASGVAAEHPEIIDGLEKVSGELVGLSYVQNTDIQVPPHGPPKDPIAIVGLRQSGLDPRTIELIGRLPCFTNDIIHEQQNLTGSQNGILVAPRSAATSYLLDTDLSDGSRNTGSDELLPSSAFQIAKAVSSHGWNLADDLETKTIIKWLQGGWQNREQLAINTFFDVWTQKLRSQEWRPRKTTSGWIIEQQFVHGGGN
ncbi:hypothetical protein Slin15195_G121380 [Septoria linicola]|uniref:Uncharacterized protein n=1 Tax=Septoria linicola TaxID=215465 RepID=A0A9Q9B0P6_9PEZI|nr:hypothetical protein Slin15195_G121380 [Septoria linicola]